MIRVSEDEFDRAVEQALAEIPPEFQRYLENVMVEVQRRPDAKLLRDHHLPRSLLGLYIGHPLEHQGPENYGHTLPDRILIFHDNICGMCDSRAELVDQIRITVLHEVGHHFGLDEDQLDDLGYG